MELKALDIAKLAGGEVSGNADAVVTGVNSLKDAGPRDAAYLSAPKYQKEFESSRAGVTLIKKGTPVADGRTVVFTDNPQFAFAKILEIIAREKNPAAPGIHPTAVIAQDARLGNRVSVGPHSVIESGAVIGDDSVIGAQCYIGRNAILGTRCLIYPQVTIREDVRIGDRAILHSGTVIGADGFGFVTVDGVHHKIPQIGTVEIQDDVEIGANVTIDRATIGRTVIGRGTKIDNLVMIAHNVQVGQGCFIVSQAGVAGSSKLGNYVTLAGQVGVVGHITIGDRVIAAAQSGIPNDVPAGSIVFGSPARPINEERKIQVIISKLPEIYDQLKKIRKKVFPEGIE